MNDQTEICATCRFWEYTHRPKDDFANGECHRNAPVPSMHMMQHIEQLLGAITWATETQAEVPHEHDKEGDDFYRSETNDSFFVWEWPITSAAHWCGEYKQSTAEVNLTEYRPAQKKRFDAVEEWEQRIGLDRSEEKDNGK